MLPSAVLKVRPYTVTANDTLESIAAKRGEAGGGGVVGRGWRALTAAPGLRLRPARGWEGGGRGWSKWATVSMGEGEGEGAARRARGTRVLPPTPAPPSPPQK
jgi:hypothetical protein